MPSRSVSCPGKSPHCLLQLLKESRGTRVWMGGMASLGLTVTWDYPAIGGLKVCRAGRAPQAGPGHKVSGAATVWRGRKETGGWMARLWERLGQNQGWRARKASQGCPVFQGGREGRGKKGLEEERGYQGGRATQGAQGGMVAQEDMVCQVGEVVRACRAYQGRRASKATLATSEYFVRGVNYLVCVFVQW